MDQPLPPHDTTPPTAPVLLNATGGLQQVGLSWSAATDDTGVMSYAVHRSTTAGFTPSDANRIGQPFGTSYTDIGLPAGTYFYRVTARDAAGNVGAANERSERNRIRRYDCPNGRDRFAGRRGQRSGNGHRHR